MSLRSGEEEFYRVDASVLDTLGAGPKAHHKLSLDAPIDDYLKSWKVPESELTAANPVTLRLLLSHNAETTLQTESSGRRDEVPRD